MIIKANSLGQTLTDPRKAYSYLLITIINKLEKMKELGKCSEMNWFGP